MKPLTFDDLANIYDKINTGRPARTLPMDKVLDWALAHKDFYEDSKGYVYYIGEHKV